MSTNWENLQSQILTIRAEFDRAYKCLNKTNLPSPATQAKHINILVRQHNAFATTLKTFIPFLTETHKFEVENIFKGIKIKLKSIFSRLEISDKVPDDCTSLLSTKIIEEESDEETETDSETVPNNNQLPTVSNTEENKVAQNPQNNNQLPIVSNIEENKVAQNPPNIAQPPTETSNTNENKITQKQPNNTETSKMASVNEFINMASKLIPEFDGSSEKLSMFINALTLVDTLKGDNEAIAVCLIKTKVSGRAQNLIGHLTSIESIKQELQSKISLETAKSVASKLLALKQKSNDNVTYAKEVEELSLKLEHAYISDGLSCEVAGKYAADVTVKALTHNAKSAETRLLLKAGQFNTSKDAVTKFVELSTETNETFSINYMRNSSHNRGRGRGRRTYHPNNQNNRGHQQNRNQRSNNQNRQNYRNSGGQNRNNRNNSNMRVIESAPENEQTPQLTLGEYN